MIVSIMNTFKRCLLLCAYVRICFLEKKSNSFIQWRKKSLQNILNFVTARRRARRAACKRKNDARSHTHTHTAMWTKSAQKRCVSKRWAGWLPSPLFNSLTMYIFTERTRTCDTHTHTHISHTIAPINHA